MEASSPSSLNIIPRPRTQDDDALRALFHSSPSRLNIMAHSGLKFIPHPRGRKLALRAQLHSFSPGLKRVDRPSGSTSYLTPEVARMRLSCFPKLKNGALMLLSDTTTEILCYSFFSLAQDAHQGTSCSSTTNELRDHGFLMILFLLSLSLS